MTDETLTTQQVARAVRVSCNTITMGIARGKLTAPAKDASGHYFWTPEQVERLRAELSVDHRLIGKRRVQEGKQP